MRRLWLVVLASCCTASCVGSFEEEVLRSPNAVEYDARAYEVASIVTGKIKMMEIPQMGRILNVFLSKCQRVDAFIANEYGAIPFEECDHGKKFSVELLSAYPKGCQHVRNEVRRIFLDDKVIFDAKVCPIHNIDMQRGISNGLSTADVKDNFLQKRKANFPFDGNSYHVDSGPSPIVWKCDKCLIASERSSLQE